MVRRIPDASTATEVTRAMPIISAAAVDAVRPGFRIEFARARRPALPPIFVAGHPSTVASGRTSHAEISATPTKRSSAPTPIAINRCVTPIPWTKNP